MSIRAVVSLALTGFCLLAGAAQADMFSLRAVQVLEHSASPEARPLLESLSKEEFKKLVPDELHPTARKAPGARRSARR